MDIKLLPAGARCLIDANILIYHLGMKAGSVQSSSAASPAERSKPTVTTTVMAEVLHRQMLIEAVTKGLVTPGKALNKLKENPAIISSLADYITEIEKLLRLPLKVVEVTSADITRSHALRQTHGLFVNDSINLACADRLGLSDIVTHDADFQRVPHVTSWEPTDV